MAENKGAQLVKKTHDDVLAKVLEYKESKSLVFPQNYVPENALRAGLLKIQQTTDRNSKPVVEVCSQVSIAQSLLEMVVFGLNPFKEQCYFIAYGTTLALSRSYLGYAATALRVRPDLKDITGTVVYEGDDFQFEKRNGYDYITRHGTSLANVSKDKIIAAYATAIPHEGEPYALVLTMGEIKEAWKMSQIHPVDDQGNIKPGSTHGKFTADMARKTVIKKLAKGIIGKSDDSNIVAELSEANDLRVAEAEAAAEIEANANRGDFVDVEFSPVDETTPAEYQAEPTEPDAPPPPF